VPGSTLTFIASFQSHGEVRGAESKTTALDRLG
jgi:hypothetical protein